jgi:hypothetical protein
MIALKFGVADPARGMAVFRHFPSGMAAVDVRDGHTLWTSDEEALPIAMNGNHVLARLFLVDDDALEFVILDAHDGSTVLRPDAVLLPHPVTTRSPEFSVTATVDAGGRFHVGWHAPARYGGGAPPPQAILEAQSAEQHDVVLAPPPPIQAESVVGSITEPWSLQFELAPDYTVIARDSTGAELWRHPLGQPVSARRALRQ